MHEAAVCVRRCALHFLGEKRVRSGVEGTEGGRMVLISDRGRKRAENRGIEYLISPEQLISAPVLEAVPNVQELGDPMGPDVICVRFCLIPAQRCPEEEQTHRDWAGGRVQREMSRCRCVQ